MLLPLGEEAEALLRVRLVQEHLVDLAVVVLHLLGVHVAQGGVVGAVEFLLQPLDALARLVAEEDAAPDDLVFDLGFGGAVGGGWGGWVEVDE